MSIGGRVPQQQAETSSKGCEPQEAVQQSQQLPLQMLNPHDSSSSHQVPQGTASGAYLPKPTAGPAPGQPVPADSEEAPPPQEQAARPHPPALLEDEGLDPLPSEKAKGRPARAGRQRSGAHAYRGVTAGEAWRWRILSATGPACPGTPTRGRTYLSRPMYPAILQASMSPMAPMSRMGLVETAPASR